MAGHFPAPRSRSGQMSLRLARHMFFEEGRAPSALVPGTVIESWRRCQAMGLTASATPDITPVTIHELNAYLERNEGLRRVSRPELEALGAVARATQSILVLTDAEGLVLETCGDMRFASRAASVALSPGTCWSEARSGTNAIGTAIAQRKGVLVRGSEHYFEPHGILSCAATPIFDPQGAMIGVLDLTSPASQAHPHTLGLVEMAVSQIEHRQFNSGFEDADVLVLSTDPALLGTAREGVLVFEGQRLVAASRMGLALAGIDSTAIGTLKDADIFRQDLTRGPSETSLRGRSHARLFARFRPHLPRQRRGARITAAPNATITDHAFAQGLAHARAWLESGLNVLIRGEAGTGKTSLALAAFAGLIDAPEVVRINAGEETPAMLEALFCSLNPASGAASSALLIEDADAMSAALQARLVRALEHAPAGTPRIIATTRALEREACLQPDLLHALAAGDILLPPLHARADFPQSLAALIEALGEHRVTPEEEALEALKAHDWPGNWRELTGVLRAALALARPEGCLKLAHLPESLRQPPATGKGADLNTLTLSAMQSALDEAGGNVSLAARKLGVDRTTLYRRLLWRRKAQQTN